LVLLLAAAQAQIASLLSTQVSNAAGSVEVSVTFTECVQGVDASSFRFFPASTEVLNGVCTEVIANQQFSCSWDLGSTESSRFSVDLPAASVTGVSGGSNTKSNKVSIQSFAPIQTDFFHQAQPTGCQNFSHLILLVSYQPRHIHQHCRSFRSVD